MSVIEFEAFPKIARLNRGMVITEKIDGTNAAVVIVRVEDSDAPIKDAVLTDEGTFVIGAQSRNRIITPEADNYGFAGWVSRNAEALVILLGEGRHFGEWWGSGIQRKYGLSGPDKRFSLFNSARWADTDLSLVVGLGIVPVLYTGPFDVTTINALVYRLGRDGSVAAPGFMRPEGVVVWQAASRTMFKVTVDGDESPKGAEGHALDVERVAS